MQSSAPIRPLTPQLAALTLLAASLSFCTTLSAQAGPVRIPDLPAQVEPANRPTAQPPSTPQQPFTPSVAQPAPRSQQHRATVTFSQGLLTISANNSSLNEILRDISRQTGMTITGGVAEERVFGNYGPSALGPILTSLLDGTRSNMLFIREKDGYPSQLILTARNGGPTPPNPNAAREEDERPPEAYAPPNPTPDQSQPPPQQNPAPPANAAAPPAASGNTTDQQSPNGVKTPQQIYDQLMKLRQPQTNTPATPQP
jgi:hypothetical protein